MKAKIAELFKSIQGEGKYAGCRQVFVRFYGCNLACRYCDTPLGRYVLCTPEELRDKVLSYGEKFVALTGGEPLIQAAFLRSFVPLLKNAGCRVLLETNATLPEQLKKIVSWIDTVSCDIKLPGATGQRAQWAAHEKFFQIARKKEVFFKAVITPRTKKADITRCGRFMQGRKSYTLYLQPGAGKINKVFLKRVIGWQDYLLDKGVDCRIMPQLHKILGIK